MSKYTTEVRFICESKAGLSENVGFNQIENVLLQSWSSIFNTSWSIFDEDYRSVLCTKILRHYYTREICCETVGLWQHWLNERMCEIMPYYNKLYESELLEFKPFEDTDYYEEGNKTDNEDETNDENNTAKSTRTDDLKNTSTGTNSSTNRFSDTPQGGLDGISANKYLTTAELNNGDYSNSGTNTGTVVDDGTSTSNRVRDFTGTEEYLNHVYGKRNSSKSYSQLLNEYRDTFLNIDSMIIHELEDLFFGLW